MSNRLSRIVTRTGDDGSTGLGDGNRVSKSSLRIAALGEVDELNAVIGVLLAEAPPDQARTILVQLQHHLFDLGGELCIPGHVMLLDGHLATLDAAIGEFNAELPSLREFILPGGCRAAALAHQARTVARRAERTIVALAQIEAVRPIAIQYLNRTSDLLFVMGRWLNHAAGVADVLWQHERHA